MENSNDLDERSVSPSFSMQLVVESVKMKFSDVLHLSTARLDKLRKEDQYSTFIFDVREEAEYNVSHIPGAVHVNPSEPDMAHIIDIIRNKECGPRTVVAYCSLGYRSCQLAQRLTQEITKESELQDTRVFNLTGSLFQWAIEGRDMLNTENVPTAYCHPYNSFFGKILPYELRKEK